MAGRHLVISADGHAGPPEAVYRALTGSRLKVRYAVVPHRLTNWIIPQLIPMRILDRLVARFMGIRRRR